MMRGIRHVLPILLLAAILAAPAVAFAVAVPVNPGNFVNYSAGGKNYFEGSVANINPSSGSAVKDVVVTAQFQDAAHNPVGATFTVPLDTAVLDWQADPAPAYYYGYYRKEVTYPAGATHVEPISAVGVPVPGQRALVLGSSWTALNVEGDTGPFNYSATATNNESYAVGSVVFTGNDASGVTHGGENLMDVLYAASPAGTRLKPGESFTTPVAGKNVKPALWSWWYQGWIEAVPYPDSIVWRFYNSRAGKHFYTSSASEKDWVLVNLGSIWQLEGVAYTAEGRPPANDTMLWRFYNMRTNTHFYTASLAEKNNILATLGGTYRFEGAAYYVSSTPGVEPGVTTVWRFYNKGKDVHLFTASLAEKNNILATLGSIWKLEGPAFYLAH
jgi:hypothetical protein